MSKEQGQLKALIWRAMLAGQLPCTSGRQLYGGKSDGATTCACCGERITSEQIQCDVDWDEEGQPGQVLSMHLPCHEMWRTEAAALATLAAGGKSAAAAKPA